MSILGQRGSTFGRSNSDFVIDGFVTNLTRSERIERPSPTSSCWSMNRELTLSESTITSSVVTRGLAYIVECFLSIISSPSIHDPALPNDRKSSCPLPSCTLLILFSLYGNSGILNCLVSAYVNRPSLFKGDSSMFSDNDGSSISSIGI